MKKVLFAVLGGIAIVGCKEKAPTIILEKKAMVDTPYIATSIPATTPHMVLIEEFTGQTCSNCPRAHETLEGFKTKYTNVIILGLYKYNVGQTMPPKDALYDFRDTAATLIGDQVYNGVNQLPTAGVDRVPVSGAAKLNQSDWEPALLARKDIVDSLNLSVTSRYDAATREVTVTADIIYTKTVTNPQNLTIAILEDNIVDKQDFPYNSGYPDDVNPAYNFTNVFRGTITSAPFGDPILATSPTKTAGMGLKRTYIYKLKSNVLKPENCRLVAYVTNATATNTAVVKAAETKLKP